MGNEFFDAGEFEFDLEKSKFIKNIDYLKSMSAEEQTFYKKWVEVQTYKDYLNKSGVVKALFFSGVVMALTNLMFTVLAWSDKSELLFATAVFLADWQLPILEINNILLN